VKHSFVILLIAVLSFAPQVALSENIVIPANTNPAPGSNTAPAADAPTAGGGAAPASSAAIQASMEAAKAKGEGVAGETQALQDAEASKKKLTEGTKGCNEASEAAKNACVESLSPFLQAAMQGLTAAMAAQQGAAGASGQCQQAQQAQQPAQQNMQKFNADCGAKKTACETKCGSAAKDADTVSTATCKADTEKVQPEIKKKAALAKCIEVAGKNKTANEESKAACAKLSQSQAAGMAGIGELLKGLMKSQSCQQEVAVDCTKTPTAAGCPQALDCNKPENDANPRCICDKNPRAPGCGGTNTAAGTTDPIRDVNAGTNDPGGGTTSPGSDGTPNSFGDSPTAAAPAAGGGGGGSSGGGSLGKGGEATEKGEKPKGVETNVLAEGGGSGGSMTSNGSVAPDEPMGKYSEFLPKDDKRNPAALSDQVSGAAGLSNWEKVRKRYTESRPTLIRPN
jgi:hypothetical protein